MILEKNMIMIYLDTNFIFCQSLSFPLSQLDILFSVLAVILVCKLPPNMWADGL